MRVELLVEMGEKGHTGEVAGELFEVVEMTGEEVERTGESGEAVEMTVDSLRSQSAGQAAPPVRAVRRPAINAGKASFWHSQPDS